MGKLLDSWADFTSFGLAPAWIFFLAIGYDQSFLYLFASVFFIFASAFRLVRFHIDTRSEEAHRKGYFRGLPTTASGGFIAAFFLTLQAYDAPRVLYLVVLVLLSFAMISTTNHVPKK